MAGFRLAPKAARARRNPWQRRRVVPSQTGIVQRIVYDGFGLDDELFSGTTVAHVVHYQKTCADGFTFSDSVVGANPSAGTATGGLFFLFSQGTSGSSYTRTASDGFTISDSVSRYVTPVSTNSYNRTCSDGFTLSDAASGVTVDAGAVSTLVGVDLEFTALLETELVFVGE